MKITRKGYYTITGPDGDLLWRDDKLLRVTSRDEAYEQITEDGRGGKFTIHCPDREVDVVLLAASALIEVSPPNLPPEWTGTPAPVVSDGVGGTTDLTEFFTDPESDAITVTLNGGSAALPTGWSISGTDLVGSGSVVEGTTAGIILDLDDGTNSLVASSSFTITVLALAQDLELPAELQFLSGFETGAVQAQTEPVDGWLEQHMNDGKKPENNKTYAMNVLPAGANAFGDTTPTPRRGTYCARFEVRSGDNPLSGSFNPRCQLVQDVNHITDDLTHYIGCSVYPVSDHQSTMNDQHIIQIFSETLVSKGPFIKVVILDDGGTLYWRIKAKWQDPSGSYVNIPASFGFANTNHTIVWDDWNDFVFEVNFDTHPGDGTGAGVAKWWLNDVLVADYSGGPLGPRSGQGSGNFRFMLDLYGGAPVAGHVIYHDSVRINNSGIGVITDVDPATAP